MAKINLTDMVTNKKVLQRRRKSEAFYGIVSSKKEVGGLDKLKHELYGLIIEGCVEGKNYRRRPRSEYIV